MKDVAGKIFSEIGIEYYSFLRYADCRKINENLISRAGISPRTALIYLIPYYTVEGENISSYAVGIDYHLVIKQINARLIEELKHKFPENEFLSFGDHSPIDERHASLVSGLGILGDSGLLINEKYGTYVFIGEIITDLTLNPDEYATPTQVGRCIGCGECKRACPTGILRGEGEECLSAITQKKGELSDSEAALMIKYNTAWGCDICQRVCPYNKSPEKTPVADFYTDTIPHLTRSLLDGMDKAEFSKRAFAWRGRKTVERNIDLLENANKDLLK